MTTAIFKLRTLFAKNRISTIRLQRLIIGTTLSLYLLLNFIGSNNGNIFIHLFSFIGCLSMVIGFYKWQQRQILLELRNKISADLHDEVGGILTGLAMQTELLETQNKDPKNHKQLRRIAEMSRRAMASMRDMVWAMDSEKDNWQSLFDRINDHAAEILNPINIQMNIQHEGVELQAELPTAMRENLYLITKEALTNVAKHAQADQVHLSLQKTENQMIFTIHDNGKVAQLCANASGIGLSNMRKRAEAIGAELEICTDCGFEICLCLKN